jgi:two-component system chemotaxis response regulator CheY
MRKKLLIVDDCHNDRKEIRAIVQNFSLLIDEVDDGEGAFNYCMNNTPDIILLDSEMPNLSGVEFLRLYKDTLGLHKKLPDVIFCATKNRLSCVDEAIELGAADSIIKPLNKKLFLKIFLKVGKFDQSSSSLNL